VQGASHSHPPSLKVPFPNCSIDKLRVPTDSIDLVPESRSASYSDQIFRAPLQSQFKFFSASEWRSKPLGGASSCNRHHRPQCLPFRIVPVLVNNCWPSRVVSCSTSTSPSSTSSLLCTSQHSLNRGGPLLHCHGLPVSRSFRWVYASYFHMHPRHGRPSRWNLHCLCRTQVASSLPTAQQGSLVG